MTPARRARVDELAAKLEAAEQRSARNASPILIALRLALEEIGERKAAEKAER